MGVSDDNTAPVDDGGPAQTTAPGHGAAPVPPTIADSPVPGADAPADDTPVASTEPAPAMLTPGEAAATRPDPKTPMPAAATGYGWSGSVVEEEDELVGQTLNGTYVIERILGEGGMGRVYLARHTRIQRKRFAIKSLHPEYVRRPDLVKRFRREAEAAAAITSEHVVGVYDVDDDHLGRPYIVAELLEGTELGDRLEAEERLSVPEAVRIVRQICRALAAAHDQGVVHRDMKPENVFLVGDPERPTAKVLDFGISRLDDGNEGTSLTKAGTVMGTPAYMPPEQARGARVDHRADIYAVGAILYRAVTGQLPFDRDDPMATVAAVLTEEPVRPRTLVASIPEGLEIVIQRAMAKDQHARFSTMQQLDDALAPFDAELTATTPRAPVAASTTGGRGELVVLLAATSNLLFFGLLSAGASLVTLLRGYGPTTIELAVVLLTMGLGLATPIFLLVRRLQRTTWQDSARVEAMVTRLRRPVGSAIAVYAGGWLCASLADFVFSSPRPGWEGWPLVWFVAAGIAAVYGRLRPAKRSIDAVLAVAVVAGTTLVTASFRGAPDKPSRLVGPPPSAAPSSSAAPELAPKGALSAAKTDGTDGLEALLAKYPRDPSVIRTAMIAHASGVDGLERAMELVEQLHAVDPRALLDPVVEQTVLEAAKGPGPGRARALSILAERMGSRGPDLLWEMAHGKSAARADAANLLARPEVQAHGTPALQIAIALDSAKGCEDKAALLERVEQSGDERAIAILEPLTRGSSRGCGLFGLGACPPACPKQAQEMKKAIDAVQARVKKN